MRTQDLAPYAAVVAGGAIRGGNGCRRYFEWVNSPGGTGSQALRRVSGVHHVAMPRADKYRAG